MPVTQDKSPERVTSRGPMVFCDTQWETLAESERLNHLEVEGYAVIPRLIDAGVIDAIKSECANLPMSHAPYSGPTEVCVKPSPVAQPVFR